MLKKEKVGKTIALYRKRCGLKQKDLAEMLHVTYQSVSRWELGISLPSVDLLYELSEILQVSVDALLNGGMEDGRDISYANTGLNTAKLYGIKEKLTEMITGDGRIVHASYIDPVLFQMDVSDMKDPVYCLTTHVPGSKARLARERGWDKEICADLVARAVNNVIRYGVRPVIFQAHVVCGGPNKEQLLAMGETLKAACEKSGVIFAGLEVSAQPVNYLDSEYEISAGLMGVLDRADAIMGEKAREGDVLIGIYTDGIDSASFPFVKLMMDRNSDLEYAKIDKEHYFVEEILKPNCAYAVLMEELRREVDVHGAFRIDNSIINQKLYRCLPDGLSACINLSALKIPPLYRFMAKLDMLNDKQLLWMFSLGVGFITAVSREQCRQALKIIRKHYPGYVIGKIKRDTGNSGEKVWTEGKIQW